MSWNIRGFMNYMYRSWCLRRKVFESDESQQCGPHHVVLITEESELEGMGARRDSGVDSDVSPPERPEMHVVDISEAVEIKQDGRVGMFSPQVEAKEMHADPVLKAAGTVLDLEEVVVVSWNTVQTERSRIPGCHVSPAYRKETHGRLLSPTPGQQARLRSAPALLTSVRHPTLHVTHYSDVIQGIYRPPKSVAPAYTPRPERPCRQSGLPWLTLRQQAFKCLDVRLAPSLAVARHVGCIRAAEIGHVRQAKYVPARPHSGRSGLVVRFARFDDVRVTPGQNSCK